MNYLARLKQLNGHEDFIHDSQSVLTEPPKVPFVSIGSSVRESGANISANDHAGFAEGLAEAASANRAAERVNRVIAKLNQDAAFSYAMESNSDVDEGAVILSVAIKELGACELRILKSRYDATALLELIKKHTTLKSLQCPPTGPRHQTPGG
jgi:hypothetical protein